MMCVDGNSRSGHSFIEVDAKDGNAGHVGSRAVRTQQILMRLLGCGGIAGPGSPAGKTLRPSCNPPSPLWETFNLDVLIINVAH